MKENGIIVFAGSAIGSVLSILEQVKREEECKTYVVCLNSNSQSIFEQSNYVDAVKTLIFKKDTEFYSEFIKWFHEVQFEIKPVVFFTTDTSCFLVNQFRNWFEINCILCLPSSEIINTYTKKGIAEIAAKKNGLLTPKTEILLNLENVENVLNKFEFPVIIKPRSTYESLKAPFKVKLLNREDFYIQTKVFLESGYSFICQEYIPGDDDTAYFYIFYRSVEGEVNYVEGRKTLQNPPRAGIMAKGLVEENIELSRQCKSFLEKIDYKGIGGIEFKKFNGKYYFIEMSTRLEGFFKISSIANVPLGFIAFNNLRGFQVVTNYKQKNESIYIDLLSMIFGHKINKNYLKILADFRRIIVSKNVQLNVYSKNDKKPFFTMLKSLI